MIQIFKSLPKEVTVAISGGIDSVTLALFLRQQGKVVNLVHYNHKSDPQSEQEEYWCSVFAEYHGFKSYKTSSVEYVSARTKASKEELWRLNRLAYFNSLSTKVLTGHHLDDAVEWYLMTALRGEPHYMRYESETTLKPFILTKKSDIVKWKNELYPEVKCLVDHTNYDVEFNDRNYVRHEILPSCLKIAPGLYTTIKNKIRELHD